MQIEPVAPESELDAVLDRAEEALERGDPAAAVELAAQVLDRSPDHPGALFLLAESFRDLRELDHAEAAYRRVTQLNPEHSVSWSGLAAIHFDLLEFEAARTCVLRAIRENPANPEGYYWRALLRERVADFRGAQRDFRRAARLEPLLFPMPVPLDEAAVDELLSTAIQQLHPSIGAYLSQVAILLEDVPDEDVCRQYDPPAPPGEILGYFSGVSYRERSIEDPWSNLPSAIVFYRRNLERIAWNQERLVEEVRLTLFHEVGEFLGFGAAEMGASIEATTPAPTDS